jgi:hypothetical protein
VAERARPWGVALVALSLVAVVILSSVPAAHASMTEREVVDTRSSPERQTVPDLTHPLGGSAPGSASLNWSNLSISDAASPPPRVNGNMVWDSTAGYVLLFGGQYFNGTTDRSQYYNDTWTYLAGTWTNVTPLLSPPARSGAMMADDPADGLVVLFGGLIDDHEANDTWEWSGSSWTNITATAGPAPPKGYWASMAYDNATATVLLFGGYNGSLRQGNDTWSFHGGKWSQLFPTDRPLGRDGQAMAFDAASDEMVMWGGLNSTYLNDTWTFAEGNWTEVGPGAAPGPRVNAGLAYYASRGEIVLYGGYPGSSDYYSTWLFSDGTWSQYALTWDPPNPQDIAEQMVYDPRDGYVFLFYEQDAYGPVVQNWALHVTTSPATLQASLAADPSTLTLGATTALTTSASGGTGPLTYVYSTLPPGCASQNLSRISCTPSTTGQYVVGVNVTDTVGGHASATATLDIAMPGLTLTASLAADPSTVGVNQSTSLVVTTSGIPSDSLSYQFSALPPGCATADSPTLDCVPTAAGTYHPAVEVHDSAGHFANATTTLTVTGPNTPANTTSSLWLWIALAVVAVAVVLLIVALLQRRRNAAARTPPPAPPPPNP